MPHPNLAKLIRQHSLMRGRFHLASGIVSNYLVDLKKTVLLPYGALMMADAILAAVRDLPDAFGGMATGAIPLVTATCLRSAVAPPPACYRPTPGFYVRSVSKGHGTNLLIDGTPLKAGMQTVLIEDVTTTGGSVLKAVKAVRSVSATVSQVITVVDRLEGAAENLAAHGITLTALLTRDDLLID